MRKYVILAIALLVLVGPPVVGEHAAAAEPLIKSSIDASALPKKKQTNLGLYITAKEASDLLQNQDNVVLIDVRTPEETVFVGYPEISAVNIPYKRIDQSYRYKNKKGSYELILNQNFVADIKTFLETPAGKKATTILLMCRSGIRSAAAVDLLAKAGITNAYTVVDGFEGDRDNKGRRTVNGWKNAGAPWTMKVRQGYLLRSSD